MKRLSILLMFLAISTGALAFSHAPSAGTAGNFSLQDLSGAQVSLGSYTGHVVLLAFFTTWCPSCQDEMPQLETLYNKFKSREFEVVGVNIDEKADSVKMFVKSNKLTFKVLLDEDGAVARKYHVRYIPKLFLLDKSGKVTFQSQYLPIEQIEKEVAKALK